MSEQVNTHFTNPTVLMIQFVTLLIAKATGLTGADKVELILQIIVHMTAVATFLMYFVRNFEHFVEQWGKIKRKYLCKKRKKDDV